MTITHSGAAERAATDRPLRCAILGCGWFGGVHLDRFRNIPNLELVAAADPDAAAAERLAQRTPASLRPHGGQAAAHTDWLELLHKEQLDFVSINTPNRWHVEQLLAALQHGMHVLCEKPLTMVPAEVEQVTRAVAETGKFVAISYQSRYRQTSRLLRSLLHSGDYGAVKAVQMYSQEDWITPNVGTWRHDPARCPGGFFADANGHQLDNLFWMTGLEADTVQAYNDTRGTPVPMVTWGQARLKSQGGAPAFRGGAPMSFLFAGDAHYWREEITIVTEGADFVIRNGELHWHENGKPLLPFPQERIPDSIRGATTVPDEAFVSAVRSGDGSHILTPPETVWPVLRFTLAGLRSAQEGGATVTA